MSGVYIISLSCDRAVNPCRGFTPHAMLIKAVVRLWHAIHSSLGIQQPSEEDQISCRVYAVKAFKLRQISALVQSDRQTDRLMARIGGSKNVVQRWPVLRLGVYSVPSRRWSSSKVNVQTRSRAKSCKGIEQRGATCKGIIPQENIDGGESHHLYKKPNAYVECWQWNGFRYLYGFARSGVHLRVQSGTLETAERVSNLHV